MLVYKLQVYAHKSEHQMANRQRNLRKCYMPRWYCGNFEFASNPNRIELIRLFCIINNSRTIFPILEFIFALEILLLFQYNAKINSRIENIVLELLIIQNRQISLWVRFDSGSSQIRNFHSKILNKKAYLVYLQFGLFE